MATTKTYTVGEYSRRFLDALDAFEEFRNHFLDALTYAYGEEQGEKFALSHNEQFEDVQRTVMDYLRVQFTMEMATGNPNVTI